MMYNEAQKAKCQSRESANWLFDGMMERAVVAKRKDEGIVSPASPMRLEKSEKSEFKSNAKHHKPMHSKAPVRGRRR
jgi:hypothetical protein